jgi:hypothetical protein
MDTLCNNGSVLTATTSRWGLRVASVVLSALGLFLATQPIWAAIPLPGPNVGPTTLLAPLPTSAYWAQLVPVCPGSNETVTINPPLFSWFASPALPSYSPYDTNFYEYIFQADYNGTFTNPVVNVTTYSSCYNFLAPFTQSPVYWRVGYLANPSNNLSSNLTAVGWLTNTWITNSFIVANNATNWDRSILANPGYMAGKQHPYIIFNGTNASTISNLIYSANPAGFPGWLAWLATVTNLSWYANPAPWTGNVDFITYASDINALAFVWEVTGNSAWTNQLCINFDNLIGYVTNANLWSLDYGNGANPALPQNLALTYDWLYPILTPAERRNAIYVFNGIIHGFLMNGYWLNCDNPAISSFPGGNSDPSGAYGGPYWVPWADMSKMGNSHPWMNAHECAFYLALASFNDNLDSSVFLNLDLNYLLGRITPYGYGAVNQGRSYSMESTFNAGTVDNNLMASIVFPEANFTMNPIYGQLGDWWSRMAPPGYDQIHEQFGDVDFGMDAKFWYSPSTSRDLAILSQSGNMSMIWQQMQSLAGYYSQGESAPETCYPHFFPVPAPTTNNILGVCYPKEGWAFGSTYPPNTTNCFYNGVGFAFMARPRGSEAGHSPFSDLDFEIWAYGANVTDGAGGSFVGNHASWTHNTLQVNGLGQCETEAQPMAPVVAQIQAFTNAPDYVYLAADATQAYPHQAFLADPWAGSAPSGWLTGSFGGLVGDGALSYVSAVRREILFEHHQYFVIYDTLETTNAPTNTFSWVYHVYLDTVTNLYAGSFQYTSPIWSFTGNGASGIQTMGSLLTNCVFQVVNPGELSATNMHGTNAYSNPITGEDYYPNALRDNTSGTANPLSANSIWVANLVPTNNFHFMTVIYPVPPGGTVPVFTRLDDATVSVDNGTQTDVISFNPQTTNIGQVTFLVNSPGIWSNAPALPTPPILTNYQYTAPVVQVSTSSTGSSGLAAPSNFRIVPPPAANLGGSALPASAFAPVPGYFAWWNPDTLGGADTAPIPSWIDLSANGVSVSQLSLSSQPLLRIGGPNGHNYLQFNGLSDFLTNTALGTLSQPIEIFCVVAVSNSTGMMAIAGNSGRSETCLGINGSQYFMVANDYAGGGTISNGWVEITATLNDMSSQIFIDGSLVVTGQRIGGNSLWGANIGAANNNGTTSFWNGSIGDLIIYTNILTTPNRQTIEQGLRAKYGF